MNEIQIFNNPQFGEIRILTDESNEPLFCASDICKVLGYANGRDAIAKHVDEADVAKRDAWVVTGTKADGTPAQRQTEMAFVNESGLYSLIFGSKLDNAKVFKRWVTSDVLPSIRKTGAYISPNAAANSRLQETEVKVYLIEAISRNLRLNEASRLGMYQSIAEPYGLTVPQYVPSKGVLKSASVLLKEIGSDMSVIRFNQLLEKKGYVETITRQSSTGKTRSFKNITEIGLRYGENEVNPKNQNETQPHWYADRFAELYDATVSCPF